METQNIDNSTETSTQTAKEAPKSPGRPRKISDETLRKAKEALESDPLMTIAKIAEEPWCDASPATLYYHLSGKSPNGQFQTAMRPKGRRGLSQEQKDLLCELHDEGKRLSAIRKDERFHNGLKEDGSPALFSLQTLAKTLKSCNRQPHVGRPVVEKPEAESAEATVEASQETESVAVVTDEVCEVDAEEPAQAESDEALEDLADETVETEQGMAALVVAEDLGARRRVNGRFAPKAG